MLRPGVAIGPGKADLLEAIDTTASLTAAAKHSGMSYKRSWLLVQEMNGAFVTPLVETIKGGAGGGGGTQLTPLGQRVLMRFREMEADANEAVAAGIADLRGYLKPEDEAPTPPNGRRRRKED